MVSSSVLRIASLLGIGTKFVYSKSLNNYYRICLTTKKNVYILLLAKSVSINSLKLEVVVSIWSFTIPWWILKRTDQVCINKISNSDYFEVVIQVVHFESMESQVSKNS